MKKQIRPYIRFKGILSLSVLFVLMISALPQQPPPVNPNLKIIELKQASSLYKRENFDAQILIDSVILCHEGAYMYCDSAYLFEQTNTFEAFSNVRMEQGDTIFVYGDYLHYDGNTRLARLRDNIRMEDKQVTLFTDSLNYDRAANLGYYFDGGMLIDEKNELTSFWGQYDPVSKDALFSDSVKLINEDYTIYSDTLKYNTETKIADILGPSTIVSDSGYINTSHGWYNTNTDDARLFNRSEIYSNDNTKMLVGDTVFYNRATGFGEVFGNMYLEDFKRKAILHGNYGIYNEKTEYGMATESAYAIDYSQSDSLFLHGDTLKMITDSIYKDIKAYYNVRFYREDIQGVCDSMNYVQKDSILYLIGNPVIWNKSNQILGNRIDVHMNDSTVEKAHVRDYALAIQDRENEGQYNQISGRDLKAFFEEEELRHVLVEGNAESLYYLVEEDSARTIIGLNKTESAYLSMDFLDDELQKLKLWSSTKAVTTPLSQLKADESKLKGFMWLDYLRPMHRMDIFRRNERQGPDSEVVAPRKFSRDDAVE
ncbi:MAG: OstA-like protein [Petrimonas sp.]|jgi:lipopolysaccharide assembly outer membrane protein LptD (OstA)